MQTRRKEHRVGQRELQSRCPIEKGSKRGPWPGREGGREVENSLWLSTEQELLVPGNADGAFWSPDCSGQGQARRYGGDSPINITVSARSSGLCVPITFP